MDEPNTNDLKIIRNQRVDYNAMLETLHPIGLRKNEAELNRSVWKIKNHGSKKAVLEIGPGTGEFVMNLAKKNPDTLFIGVEKKFKQAYKIARKVKRSKLENLKIVRNRAERIPYLFGAGEINETYLLFPDPWPKTAQNKNRLVNVGFLEKLHRVTRNNGFFHIRTDSAEYFSWIEAVTEKTQHIWKIVDLSRDLYSQENFCEKPVREIEKTLFENIWINEGKKINAVTLKSV